MLNFREFEAGPDPFGHKFQVLLKWLQTAISIRHADAVDVKFVLTDESGARTERTISLPHAELARTSAETSRPMDDAWCARLARLRLEEMVKTGEDIEKDLVSVGPAEIRRLAAALAGLDQAGTRLG
jgi:hypothetical protein